jgi:hypothetical protein
VEASAVPDAGGEELPIPAPPSVSSVGPARPGNGAADAVFSGQLSSFAIPDLLEFLRSGRRTGLLVCSCTSGIGALRFKDGKIVSAASPGTPNLAVTLARASRISEEQLQALTAAELPDDVLAERLVAGGLADPGEVLEALSQQVWVAVRELVRWRDGEFAFNRDDGAAGASGLAPAVDPQEVLLDVFKEMDEASRGSSAPAA